MVLAIGERFGNEGRAGNGLYIVMIGESVLTGSHGFVARNVPNASEADLPTPAGTNRIWAEAAWPMNGSNSV
jgi:hypothetical protein